MSTTNVTLCVPRASSGLDPSHPALAETPKPMSIPENHVLIRVDRFGFSANNITYQALGEAPNFRYASCALSLLNILTNVAECEQIFRIP